LRRAIGVLPALDAARVACPGSASGAYTAFDVTAYVDDMG